MKVTKMADLLAQRAAVAKAATRALQMAAYLAGYSEDSLVEM